MNNLSEKEQNELKTLEDPNVQYSTPSSAFLMGWYYKRQRQKRIEKLKTKLNGNNTAVSSGNAKNKILFIIIYYIIYLVIFYLLSFLLEYNVLAEFYLIAFIVGLFVPFFIKRNI